MKKWMIFVAGLIAGFLLAFVIDQISNKASTYSTEGFENGEIIKATSFKVTDVLQENVAVVNDGSAIGCDKGIEYLLVGKEGSFFYDGQIVIVPKGKTVRRNGTCQYQPLPGLNRTLPRIMIMDK